MYGVSGWVRMCAHVVYVRVLSMIECASSVLESQEREGSMHRAIGVHTSHSYPRGHGNARCTLWHLPLRSQA